LNFCHFCVFFARLLELHDDAKARRVLMGKSSRVALADGGR
jgi:hypothetical protein